MSSSFSIGFFVSSLRSCGHLGLVFFYLGRKISSFLGHFSRKGTQVMIGTCFDFIKHTGDITFFKLKSQRFDIINIEHFNLESYLVGFCQRFFSLFEKCLIGVLECSKILWNGNFVGGEDLFYFKLVCWLWAGNIGKSLDSIDFIECLVGVVGKLFILILFDQSLYLDLSEWSCECRFTTNNMMVSLDASSRNTISNMIFFVPFSLSLRFASGSRKILWMSSSRVHSIPWIVASWYVCQTDEKEEDQNPEQYGSSIRFHNKRIKR